MKRVDVYRIDIRTRYQIECQIGAVSQNHQLIGDIVQQRIEGCKTSTAELLQLLDADGVHRIPQDVRRIHRQVKLIEIFPEKDEGKWRPTSAGIVGDGLKYNRIGIVITLLAQYLQYRSVWTGKVLTTRTHVAVGRGEQPEETHADPTENDTDAK